MKEQEVWGKGAQPGEASAPVFWLLMQMQMALPGLSVGPERTLQDLGDHVAPNSLQGPDNTGEMTE